jgi:hypothetical protein
MEKTRLPMEVNNELKRTWRRRNQRAARVGMSVIWSAGVMGISALKEKKPKSCKITGSQ